MGSLLEGTREELNEGKLATAYSIASTEVTEPIIFCFPTADHAPLVRWTVRSVGMVLYVGVRVCVLFHARTVTTLWCIVRHIILNTFSAG